MSRRRAVTIITRPLTGSMADLTRDSTRSRIAGVREKSSARVTIIIGGYLLEVQGCTFGCRDPVRPLHAPGPRERRKRVADDDPRSLTSVSNDTRLCHIGKIRSN